MNRQLLLGARLESLRFSRSSYTLEFSKGEDVFEASTTFALCRPSFLNEGIKDAEAEISQQVWELLETSLVDFIVDHKNFPKIRLIFQYDRELLIWSEQSPLDNLLIVRSKFSDTWFVLG